jgi:hypothetical protein
MPLIPFNPPPPRDVTESTSGPVAECAGSTKEINFGKPSFKLSLTRVFQSVGLAPLMTQSNPAELFARTTESRAGTPSFHFDVLCEPLFDPAKYGSLQSILSFLDLTRNRCERRPEFFPISVTSMSSSMAEILRQ